MKIDVTHDVKMSLAASVCGCNDANEFMIKRDSLVYDLKLLQLSFCTILIRTMAIVASWLHFISGVMCKV